MGTSDGGSWVVQAIRTNGILSICGRGLTPMESGLFLAFRHAMGKELTALLQIRYFGLTLVRNNIFISGAIRRPVVQTCAYLLSGQTGAASSRPRLFRPDS